MATDKSYIDPDPNDKDTFKDDLFIGFISGEKRDVAQKVATDLYNKLKVIRGLSVYAYCAEKTNEDFRTTPNAVMHHAKSFLLVVDSSAVHYDKDPRKPIMMVKERDEAGKIITKKASLAETDAAIQNKYIQSCIESGIKAIRVFYVPDKITNATPDFDIGSAFDGDDFVDGHNPFSGTTLFYPKPDGSHIQDILNWVMRVREHSPVNPQEIGYHIYWVGTRLSDIEDCDDIKFTGSVCLFGKNDGNNRAFCTDKKRIDHNALNDEADIWVYQQIKDIAAKDPLARFYCYNPLLVYTTYDEDGVSLYKKANLLDRFLCLNKEEDLAPLRKKDYFRDLCLSSKFDTAPIHMLKSVSHKKADITYRGLIAELCEGDYEKKSKPRFIIQAPVSSGGESTFILDGTPNNRVDVFSKLRPGTDYICTEYQEHCISVNVHAFIFRGGDEKPRILMSTPSIQLSKESGNRIIYRGGDFVECENVARPLMEEFLRQAKAACERIYYQRRLNGDQNADSGDHYLGVCGIDAIINDAFRYDESKGNPYDHIYLLEANARFQASTALFNKALKHLRDQRKSGIKLSAKSKMELLYGERFNTASFPSLQVLNRLCFSDYLTSLPDALRFLEDGVPLKENEQFLILDAKSRHKKYQLPLYGGMPFTNIEVPYSNFCYINNGFTEQAYHLLNNFLYADEATLKKAHIVGFELDGLNPHLTLEKAEYEADAHLYRVVFDTNICWVNPESRLNYIENIIDEDLLTYTYILGDISDAQGPTAKRERMIRTKVALIIQGIALDPAIKQMRAGTFQAIDIVFKSKEEFANFVVNAPVTNPTNLDEPEDGVKFTSLTPFKLEPNPENINRVILTYYGKKIDDVFLFPEDVLGNNSHSIDKYNYDDLAYLSTDRLRVHLTNACKFKFPDISLQCKFCGITASDKGTSEDKRAFSKENMKVVLKDYVATYYNKFVQDEDGKSYFPALRHFLVGGQSANLGSTEVEERLIDTVRSIAMETNESKEIYAMILPCKHTTISAMQRAGLRKLAFNIEIYDDQIAKDLMPGKRERLSTKDYLEYLSVAHNYLDEHEAVRSMLMVGLEPMKSTKKGIQQLLMRDIQPMLSIFRPMPDTDCVDYISPSITDVVALYDWAYRKCHEKKYPGEENRAQKTIMHLGPDCVCCQNNTVSLPYEVEDAIEPEDADYELDE